jgi:hypothetical protein
MSEQLENKKKLQFVFEKRKIAHIKGIRVGKASDVSGSTSLLWQNGTMQTNINRFFAIADRMDDNHSMDNILFDDKIYETVDMTPENYMSFANDHVINNKEIGWNGTIYSLPLDYMHKLWFPKQNLGKSFLSKMLTKNKEKQKKEPAFLMFETDGECFKHDEKHADMILNKMSKDPVYVVFIALKAHPSNHFTFIKNMADKYQHVGIVIVDDIKKLTSEKLYEHMITEEVANWFKQVSE